MSRPRDDARDTAIALEVALGVRTLAEIGSRYGLTKQRVLQIGNREGVTRNRHQTPGLRHGLRYPCRTCGQPVFSGEMRRHRLGAGHSSRAGKRTTQAHLDLMREFYDRGLGFVSIGDLMGYRHTNVKYHLVRMGARLHGTGKYPRDGTVLALRAELALRVRLLTHPIPASRDGHENEGPPPSLARLTTTSPSGPLVSIAGRRAGVLSRSGEREQYG